MAVDSLGTMGASAPVSGSTFLLWSLAVMVFGAMVGAAGRPRGLSAHDELLGFHR
jgi:hypothetical protein